ncbi:MAG: beta-N-acetylhexosaminidase, partial [Alistipes sp.]|nr:beta-N-acetylhexosaminidase [Alistipes sp.]
MKPLLLLVAALCGTAASVAQTLDALIPQPRRAELLSDRLVAPDTARHLRVRLDAPAEWGDEAYALLVAPKRIEIRAKTPQGVVWARRTLDQLRTDDGRYPHVRIEDGPEFPVRGFLWDDGRNFAGVELVKHWLDLMSAYKLNLFQWHLTDKPAWRIECRCHPELNDPRYQRPGRDTGCFYTYDQIREVIAYAAERGIRVVPEIDMPGHSDYFNATFGFAMDSPEGMRVLEECIAEFCRELPADLCPTIHIGSDEVRIADPSGFMEWAQRTVRRHGRSCMAWDPGLPADSLTVRQYWREAPGETTALPAGHPAVDSSMGYLNLYDPLLMPAKLYFYTPCGGDGRASDTALGGILCLWNDVRAADKRRAELHSGLAGGIMAFAERFWNGGRTADDAPGTLLPPAGSEAVRGFEAFQRRMADHKRRFLPREMSYWTPIRATEWEVTFTGEGFEKRVRAWGDVIDLDALCRRHAVPDGPLDVRLVRTIRSESDTVRYFRAGFDHPQRSNRISDGIPEQGCWPNHGTLSVNGEPVAPPRYEEPGAYRFHFHTWARPEEEYPYTDEQLYWMQRPVAVTLRRGDNRVELT